MPDAAAVAAGPAAGSVSSRWPRSASFAAMLFAVTFALNLSDYLSRYVVIALFGDLQREWSLDNAQLGALVSLVAIAVGLLTIPVALLCERIGKARGLLLMALLWSVATFGSAYAASYGQMLASRIVVGIGEAAYSSVGLAFVLAYFPASMRASISGAFLAGGPLGQILGVCAGATIAAEHGWRAAFSAMAMLGLILAFLFYLLARKADPAHAPAQSREGGDFLAIVRTLLTTRAIGWAMLGSGLQLFAFAGFLAWSPRWLELTYRLSTVDASKGAAALVLIGTLGMPLCSAMADRWALNHPHGRANAAMLFCAITGTAFAIGFAVAPGSAQLLLVACGVFTVGAAVGPTSAILAQHLRPAIHGVAFSCGTVANNLIGQGPAPWVIGKLADSASLPLALSLSSVASFLACGAYLLSVTGRAQPAVEG